MSDTLVFQGVEYVRLFPDAMRDLTAEEDADLGEAIGREKVVLKPIVTNGSQGVIDGWNRLRWAIKLGLESKAVKFSPDGRGKSVEEQERMCRDLNDTGRQDSFEVRQKNRSKRIETVAELRTTGKSTREIAETVGVSQTQVVADLKAATEQGCSVQPPGGVVNSQDGVQRPANKPKPTPILCSRCARVGAVKGCSMCKEERAHAAKGKMKRKTAPAASVDPLKDDHGNEIPAKRRAAWADPWIQETYDLLAVALDNLLNARLAAGMNKRAKHYPFFNAKDFCDGYGFLTNYIEDLITHLRDNRPSGVCPCCEGVGCGECRQSGLVPRETYKTLTKKEKAK